jgi:hypothetical protein
LLVRNHNAHMRKFELIGSKQHLTLRALFSGYVLVVLRRPSEAVPSIAVEACAYALATEAGYPSDALWAPVMVETNASGLPSQLFGDRLMVENIRVMRHDGALLFHVRDTLDRPVQLARVGAHSWYASRASYSL